MALLKIGMSIQLSIITVCRNSVSDLEKTLESVFKNRRRETEYVVVDGESTDGTLFLLSKYNNQIDVLISERDRGIYHAMNKGISVARGKYIVFINSGDILLPKAFEKLGAAPKNMDIYFFGYRFFKPTKFGDIFINGRFRDIRLEMPTCHNAIFFKRALFNQLGGFDEDYKIVSDYEWLVRTFEKTKTCFVEEPVVLYLKGGFSETKHLQSLFDRGKVAFKYFGVLVLPAHIWNFLKILPVYLLKRLLTACGLFEYFFYLRNRSR
ncbi:MAG: glycosyltransferase family 2 protein [Nitrospinota bacterium]